MIEGFGSGSPTLPETILEDLTEMEEYILKITSMHSIYFKGTVA
jgi:hypothetical protein